MTFCRPHQRHALLLNMTGDRDCLQIMQPLLSCAFDKVFFSPNIFYSPNSKGKLLCINLHLNQTNKIEMVKRKLNETKYSSVLTGDSVNLRVTTSNQLKQTKALHDLWISNSEIKTNGNVSDSGPAGQEVHLKNSVNEALAELQDGNTEWCVLVTGSLHLVGAVLSVIDPELTKSAKT